MFRLVTPGQDATRPVHDCPIGQRPPVIMSATCPPLPGRLHLRAGFGDYRAQERDIAVDDEDAAAGRRLTMPVLALWGSAALPARLPTLEIWRQYADSVTGAEIPECGHFIPEERPDALLTHLREFLG